MAAGKGSRFGSTIAKQYTPVHGKTILQQSVLALSRSEHITEVFLVIAADDTVAQTLSFSLPITFATGALSVGNLSNLGWRPFLKQALIVKI
nr:2-C-methyl-D-erythritol 4-phosphate cytidylyltransferase [Psychrobacter sp. PraFG1]UTT87667.1 2-C-methyl-D-erythritol 4-phosphate cytidylyltransferase [Psychrobacter sp. PraFG1]